MNARKEARKIAADLRKAEYQKLTLEQKREKCAQAPGNCTRQLKKLARKE